MRGSRRREESKGHEDGEEGEDGGEGGLAVDDEEGDVVDLEAVGEVADAFAIVMGVGDDDDLVAAVYELAGELVNVRLNTSGLGEEEVADHGDVVRLAGHPGCDVVTSHVVTSSPCSRRIVGHGEMGDG